MKGYVALSAGIALWMGAPWMGPHPAAAFDCTEIKCGAMSSCAEAHYKLTVCGHAKRDGDRNGIPCEDICGSDTATYQARVRAQWPSALPFVAIPDRSVLPHLIGEVQAEGGPPSSQFRCAGKRTCKQMVSCAEARFYLSQCGAKSLDGDGDGTPCNALCR